MYATYERIRGQQPYHTNGFVCRQEFFPGNLFSEFKARRTMAFPANGDGRNRRAVGSNNRTENRLKGRLRRQVIHLCGFAKWSQLALPNRFLRGIAGRSTGRASRRGIASGSDMRTAPTRRPARRRDRSGPWGSGHARGGIERPTPGSPARRTRGIVLSPSFVRFGHRCEPPALPTVASSTITHCLGRTFADQPASTRCALRRRQALARAIVAAVAAMTSVAGSGRRGGDGPPSGLMVIGPVAG